MGSSFICGGEAFDFLRTASPLNSDLVDIVVICAPTESETVGKCVAQNLQNMWTMAMKDNFIPREIVHMCAQLGVANARDLLNQKRKGDILWNEDLDLKDSQMFPFKTDCADCKDPHPTLRIAILDAGFLWIDSFLDSLQCLASTGKVMFVPVLTNRFLSLSELLIRTYYLKLTARESHNIVPAYVEPLRVCNYLFDHIRGIRFYSISRWGTFVPGMYKYNEISFKRTLLIFFVVKLHQRRKKCFHGLAEKDIECSSTSSTSDDDDDVEIDFSYLSEE